jgi:hypothetical protein
MIRTSSLQPGWPGHMLSIPPYCAVACVLRDQHRSDASEQPVRLRAPCVTGWALLGHVGSQHVTMRLYLITVRTHLEIALEMPPDQSLEP